MKEEQTELTQDRLQELFDYDPNTGLFTRKVFRGNTARPGAVARRLHKSGHIKIMVDKREYLAHRLAWLYVYGYMPPQNIEIDHIDTDRANNRISNLRLATDLQNAANSSVRKNNLLGVKGVHRVGRKYIAQLRHKGAWVLKERFDTIDAAVRALESVRKSLHGEYARG